MIVRRLAPWIGFPLLATAVVLVGGWCALAVWYRVTASEPVRGVLAGAIVVLAFLAVACLATPKRWFALAAFIALFSIIFAWWATIVPSNDRNWMPDVA